MKKYFVLLPVFLCLLQACSSSKKTSGTSSSAVAGKNGAASNASADGSSFEKAIVIKSGSETAGVKSEYTWLAAAYPGYTLVKQQLSFNDKKPYDLMFIKTKDGDNKTLYFDISAFYGKF